MHGDWYAVSANRMCMRAGPLAFFWDVGDEERLANDIGVGVSGTFEAQVRRWDVSSGRNDGGMRARHTEASLARDMGTAPVVECRGMVKVRAGRVIGVFLGPNDMAEMLRVTEFNAQSALVEGSMQVGTMFGVSFFLLDEDMP